MQIIDAIKPFEIQEVELSSWKVRPVKNNFFELVLIKSGEGTQCINYNNFDYQEGSMFLLPPLKCHSFAIKKPTKFVFLKFTDSFFRTPNHRQVAKNEWFKEASYILSNYNQLPGDIIKSETDKLHISNLFDMILLETRNYGTDSVNLITSLMTSILEILIRNIKKSNYFDTDAKVSEERITKMLTYINENIDRTDLLKVENLAEVFMMSPTYVSEYFKKQVHISLREYIIKARLKLVEIRLLNSDYTLTQIADDLGFTDVSHLSKTFKRYVGTSIKEFKNNGSYMILARGACAS
ncbi:AraC family transcriptional regulator [Maribacter sp. IgM3_T14_3]|uniref:AraC family transcriptional regulator n=1 Tax=Maribacter sp. IgM3_T14_3 TaxID=3415140 RepID=UPI003C6F59E9